jgi:ABC-2 type transport system permease protein
MGRRRKMAEQRWPRHALGIGVFEFRRSVRVLWQDKARLGLQLLGMVIPSLMVGVFVYVFADTIRGVDTLPVPAQMRGTVALFWLFATFLIGQRVVSARTRIEAEPLMLTTVSARTVAAGLIVAETLRILANLVVPVLIFTGVGVLLFGSPASLLLVPATAVLFALTAVVTGTVFGYAIALLVATSQFVARHKMVLGSIASLVGTGLFFLFFYPQLGGVSQASLAWLPVGWFVDLGVVGTGLADAPGRSVGAVLASLGILIVAGAIVDREVQLLWFIEPVSVDTVAEDETHAPGDAVSSSIRGDPLASAVRPLVVPRIVSTPVRRVAEWVLLRTRRDPNRLMFLLIPVFAIGSPLLSSGAQSGSIDALASPLAAVAIPWLAGSVVALNPLGDEGTVLPVTLTAISGKQYVRGLVVPGLVFGLPIALVVTALGGLISPYPLVERVGLIALSGFLTVVSVTITPAIGMALPRFSPIRVGQSRDVLPPRMSAVAVHAALVLVPGGFLVALLIAPVVARAILAGIVGYVPAILLNLLSGAQSGILASIAGMFARLGDGVLAIELGLLQIAGGGLLLLASSLLSVILYRNAVQRFDRYTPP